MPAMHSFAVAAKPVDAAPVVLDGTHLQEPVLPRWIIKAVLALVLFVLILVALWIVLLNPPGEKRSSGVALDSVALVGGAFAAPDRL
jgi:hypothetical protein